jgi:hypothetical protein
MFSGAVEPECRRPLRVILLGIIHSESGSTATTVQTPAALLTSADDARERGTTTAVTHATVHATVNGATMARREAFLTATPTSVGVCGASVWAKPIAVN